SLGRRYRGRSDRPRQMPPAKSKRILTPLPARRSVALPTLWGAKMIWPRARPVDRAAAPTWSRREVVAAAPRLSEPALPTSWRLLHGPGAGEQKAPNRDRPDQC